jgi:hypothetical protein
MLGGGAPSAAGGDVRREVARAVATALRERRPIRPATHTTDFGNEAIGCVTLTQRELGRIGYRGHAFACEEGATGEVMGAVLTRPGVVRCYVAGAYAGEGCYTLDVCGYAETLCFD